jgi:hypothetical protein
MRRSRPSLSMPASTTCRRSTPLAPDGQAARHRMHGATAEGASAVPSPHAWLRARPRPAPGQAMRPSARAGSGFGRGRVRSQSRARSGRLMPSDAAKKRQRRRHDLGSRAAGALRGRGQRSVPRTRCLRCLPVFPRRRSLPRGTLTRQGGPAAA